MSFMLIKSLFVLTIVSVCQSVCPSIDTINSLPSKTCTFIFSQSSSSCQFNSCSNPSIGTSNDWSTCIQTCCNNMTPPRNQDPSGVQQCIDYVSSTTKGSTLGTKDIFIIIAINIGAMILLFLFVKIFGNCCCDTESACYFDKTCGCCIKCLEKYFATNNDGTRISSIASMENIAQANQSIPANQVKSQEQILDNWETDDHALKGNLCTICLDETSNTVLECGHWFHYQCIGRWAKAKKECPNCKKQGLKHTKIYCGQCLSNWQFNKEGFSLNMKIICQPCKEIQK